MTTNLFYNALLAIYLPRGVIHAKPKMSVCLVASFIFCLLQQRMRVEMKLEDEDISRKLNEMLELESGSVELVAGFQATVGIITCPPCPILTLSLSSQYGL